VACVEAHADAFSILDSGCYVFDVFEGGAHAVLCASGVLQEKGDVVLNCGEGIVYGLNDSFEASAFSVSEVAA